MKKLFKALFAILRNPWLLNNVLSDDSVWNRYILKIHEFTNGLSLLDINLICPDFSETLECFAFLDGGSLPTDIALLKSLSKKVESCKYFEIGTWRGESVVNVAENAAECYTLNLSKEELQSLGLSDRYADNHGLFSKGKKNIIHLTGNSLTFDYQSLDKKFDLIFIDGDHHYDFVKSDTENIFRHLVHDKSIVVWHDYGFQADKIRYEVMAAILDGVGSERAPLVYHVAHTKCAIYTGKKMSAASVDFPIVPEAYFNMEISRHTNK